MAAEENNDSGMASLQDSSKDVTPEKPKSIVNDDSDDEEFLDETLSERLWGLTEMFPESLVNFTCKATNHAVAGVKGFYKLSRNVVWIFFSSSVILLAPVVFEVERAQMEESQRSQQKQFLLGPNAMTSNLSPNMAMMPTR